MKTKNLNKPLTGGLSRSGGILLLVANATAALAAAVLQAVAARTLNEAQYAPFGILLGLQLLIAAPLLALQIAVAEQVARVPQLARPVLDLRRAVGWTLAAVVLLLPVGPLAVFLPTDDRLTLGPALAALTAVGVVSALLRGVTAGKSSFATLALAVVIGALARLGATLWLLGASTLVVAAVGGAVVGEAATSAWLAASRRRAREERAVAVTPSRSVFVWGSYSLVVLFGASWVGEPLAEARLGAAAAAPYVAASAVGRAMLIVLQAVALAAAGPLALDRSPALRRYGTLMLAVGGASVTVALAVPTQLAGMLFGSDLQASGHLMWATLLSATLLGLVNLLQVAGAVQGDHRTALWSVSAVLVTAAATAPLGRGPLGFAVAGVVGAATAILLSAWSTRAPTRAGSAS